MIKELEENHALEIARLQKELDNYYDQFVAAFRELERLQEEKEEMEDVVVTSHSTLHQPKNFRKFSISLCPPEVKRKISKTSIIISHIALMQPPTPQVSMTPERIGRYNAALTGVSILGWDHLRISTSQKQQFVNSLGQGNFKWFKRLVNQHTTLTRFAEYVQGRCVDFHFRSEAEFYYCLFAKFGDQIFYAADPD